MKTAADWIKQLTVDPASSHLVACECNRCNNGYETFLLPEYIRDIQLDAMRYGMEQAAKLCEKEGDNLGDGHELSEADCNKAAGCYNCQYMLEHAAKTAQLP